MNAWAFVKEPADFEQLAESRIVKAVKAADNGNMKPLKEMYSSIATFGGTYLLKGGYKLLGWYFDLTPYCKTYLVNEKHYGWQEYRTPNKTCLYNMIGRHNVLEIIEK